MTGEFTGTGDPARSMAPLWPAEESSTQRAAPGSNQRHTVAQIVGAAIELADARGITSLSMRKVSQQLGVGTMSIYTYIPAKAELLDSMLDTVYGEAASNLVDGGWRDRLEQVARENWALYQRHPWLLQVATGRPPLGPNLIAKYELELSAVDGIGLNDVEMDSVITLVNGFVHGAARGAAEATAIADQTGVTDEQWWAAIAPYLVKAFDATTFPLASRVGAAAGEQHGAEYDFGHAFEFGLARLLDGIEVFISRRAN